MTLRACYPCIKCALLRFDHSIPILGMYLCHKSNTSEAGFELTILL